MQAAISTCFDTPQAKYTALKDVQEYYLKWLFIQETLLPNDPFMWCGSIPAMPPIGPSPPGPIGNCQTHTQGHIKYDITTTTDQKVSH